MRRILAACSLALVTCLLLAFSPALAGATGASAAAAGDPVIAAAGDIACQPGGKTTSTKCHQSQTADLLAAGNYAAVLPVGDEQYACGQLTAYRSVYDSTWGRFNSSAHPVVGDNDYASSKCSTPGAEGYYTYFGDRASPDQPGCTKACKGYYSYDIGAWHIVALNSECTQPGVGGCAATDPMGTWLKNDLAAHPTACTLAYWHRPYWANGSVTKAYKPLVQILYDAGVEILLVGHNHIYTRYAPQDPNSVVDPHGVRQFTIGIGGVGHGSLSSTALPNAEKRDNSTFGIFELTLHPTSYDYRFVTDKSSGSFTDSGTGQCFGGSAPGPQQPSVTTGSATVGQTTATLTGTVNPNGTSTSYKFEYGTTTSYGSSTASTSAGSGTTTVNASASLSGLSTGTTYHYRIVATSSAGTVTGADRTFTTGSTSGQCTPGSVTAQDSADTFVYAGATTKNYGTDTVLKPNNVGTSSERDAFLTFDTPTIPSGCTVSGVTLTMVSSQVTSGQQSLSVYAQDAATWTETGLTWANRPGRGAGIASNLTFYLQSAGQQQTFALPAGPWLHPGAKTSISITATKASAKLFASREDTSLAAPVLRIDYS